MMLIDFWVKFQDEKLASPSFGQSKWAGHESKYWNWTNCATLKLAGLFFQSNLRSYLNCQEYLFKMSIKSFVCVISIDRRQRVGLKATPPPPEDFVRCIERILRLYGEIDALCRRAHKIGFLLFFFLPQKIRIDFGTANKPRLLVYSTPSNSHCSFSWGCHSKDWGRFLFS
jgi:hypothetical protein